MIGSTICSAAKAAMPYAISARNTRLRLNSPKSETGSTALTPILSLAHRSMTKGATPWCFAGRGATDTSCRTGETRAGRQSLIAKRGSLRCRPASKIGFAVVLLAPCASEKDLPRSEPAEVADPGPLFWQSDAASSVPSRSVTQQGRATPHVLQELVRVRTAHPYTTSSRVGDIIAGQMFAAAPVSEESRSARALATEVHPREN